MASLYNNKISTTYVGLIKTIDNAVISASLRELSDGSGNATGLYVNTAGDFKVTSILEFGSLKDTGEGITITKFVDEADGIASNDNDTTIPTSAAVVDYVASRITLEDLDFSADSGTGSVDLDSQVFAIVGTTNEIETSGGSQQLQIGLPTNITITGTTTFGGNLIGNTNIILKDTSDNTLAAFYSGGKGEIYFNNSKKFETTSDGATVTGGLTATGSSVFTAASFSGTITGDVTGNLTGNVTGNLTGDTTGNVTATSVLASGVTATTQSASDNSTKVATTAYVETAVDTVDTLAEILVIGNTTGATKIEVDNTSGGIDFIDSAKARFGTGNDLEIYHDASNSYVKDSGQGSLFVQGSNVYIQSSVSKTAILCNDSASVDLYYNAVKKFETSSAGATVTGDLDVTGTITGSGGSFLPLAGGTMTGDTLHADSVSSYYGAGNDLRIYHTGSTSYIQDVGTGSLIIDSSDLIMRVNGSENAIIANSNGAVDIYYNNSKKFETTNSGVAVTGALTTTGNINSGGHVYVTDGNKFFAGSGEDFQIYHDGTDNQILANIVGQSTIIKTSNASSGDVTALTITANGDLSTGRDVTIAGDLTVNGTTTTVNTDHFNVEDPLISMAKDNAANSVDIGYYGRYNDGTQRYLGLFSDASDSNTWKLFKGLTVEPTTTVDTTATGYALADLDVATITTSDVYGTSSLRLAALAGTAYLDSGSGASVIIRTNGTTTALTLDSSQNATFAGNVDVTGGINIPLGTVGNPTGGESLHIRQIATYGASFRSRDWDGATWKPMSFEASSFDFYNGNSTFAGTIDSGAITSTGLITGAKSVFSSAATSAWVTTIRNSAATGASYGLTIEAGTNASDLALAVRSKAVTDLFTVNGLGNATFAGDVGIGQTGNAKLEVLATSGEIFRADSSGGAYRLVVNQTGANIQGTLAVLGNITTTTTATFGGHLQAENRLTLTDAAAGATRYILTDETSTGTGVLVLQAGQGSAAYGGALGMYANAHASKAGDVYAGISSGSGGSFRVNTSGTDNGTDLLTINQATGATFAGNVEINGATGITGLNGITFQNGCILDDSIGAEYLKVTYNGSGAGGIQLFDNDDTLQGYIYADGGATSSFGFLSGAGQWALKSEEGGTTSLGHGSNGIKLSTTATGVNITNTGSPPILSIQPDDPTRVDTISFLQSNGNSSGSITYYTNPTVEYMAFGVAYNTTERQRLKIDSNGLIAYAPAGSGTGSILDLVGNNTSGYGSTSVAAARISATINGSGNAYATNLNFYTTNSSNVKTLALYLDHTQSANFAGDVDALIYKVEQSDTGTNIVASSSYGIWLKNTSDTDGNFMPISFSNSTGFETARIGAEFQDAGDRNTDLFFCTRANGGGLTERMRINAAGNVGIGTDSPAYKMTLSVNPSFHEAGLNTVLTDANANQELRIISDAHGGGGRTGDITFYTANSATATERMRITSGGDICVNKTSSITASASYGNITVDGSMTVGPNLGAITADATINIKEFGGTSISFFYGTTKVGSITNTASATAYNTSSDYRLKEDLQDFNGLDKVSKIPVYDFKWKSDDSRSYGVLAHELEEVLPQAVSGEKDAEKMQSVDYSKIVPLLVKSIQELKAEIDELKKK